MSILHWFSGGSTHYHNLVHCMGFDWAWIWITVALDVAVAGGYLIIAGHWQRNQARLRNEKARVALGRMRNIFIFCGICGYIFIPVKMFWPAWRLYDMFLAVLVYFTWRYALDSRNLGVVYSEINRSEELQADLAASREESKRKSHFLNAVSHDLRTPLNGLLLQVDYAAMALESGDKETAQSALMDAKVSAKATAELLNSFLELARLDWSSDRCAVSRFDVGAMVEQCLSSVRGLAEQKGLELTARVPSGLAFRTDRVKLERVLSNLLSNAVKFTERGSVSLELARMAGTTRLVVSDTGAGICAEDQARLFEEFFQVSNIERDRKKGFGLGLAISRRLVRQMGGEIEFESKVGVGSRFSVVLPNTVEEEVGGSGVPDDGKPQVAVAAG